MANRLTKINDNRIRLVLIPFFGIIIPNLTGLFGPFTATDLFYWIGYAYFILVSYLIYQGNRWLLFKQREHFDWFKNPLRKLVVLVFANIFYTAPVTVIMIRAWYQLAGFSSPDWNAIQMVTLMNVIAVIFVTHVYETVFLIKEREDDLLQVERLQRSRVESELQALKSQIDPHFMFNSMNTLSHLILTDRQKALAFNENLADVYRYILMNKDRELVPLQQELDFFNNYLSLLRLRFGKSIQLEVDIRHDAQSLLIPPISLQLLLENAVKHNRFDNRDPLCLKLDIQAQSITLSNTRRPKARAASSAGIGLKNLGERYRLITGKEILIQTINGKYSVQLPLLESQP